MSDIPQYRPRCFFCDRMVDASDALIHYLSGRIVCRECADYNRVHGHA